MKTKKQTKPIQLKTPVEKDGGTRRATFETKGGNLIQFFYNPANNLVVVDLVAGNEMGGNEIFRKTLDENALLRHTKEQHHHD